MDQEGAPAPARGRQPLAYRVYAALVALSAAAFLPLGVPALSDDPVTAVAWVLFTSTANVISVPMSPTMGLVASLGAPITVASAVVLSPALALLVNFFSVSGPPELSWRASWFGIAFNRGQFALCAGAASLAAHAVDDLGPVAATLAAGVVYNVVNTAAVTAAVWCRRGLRFSDAARSSSTPFPRFALDFALLTLLALIIVVVYPSAGPLAVALVIMPMWLGYSALSSARESEDRAAELAVRVRELETLNALGTELLAARQRDEVATIGARALRAALDADDAEVSLSGDVADGLAVVKIPGAEPAAAGVPGELGHGPTEVAEGIAGLLGLALQRMELEHELAEVERARAALSSQILEEGTRERSRIALEIHDDVLPYLAAAEIQADNVRSALARADQGRADRLATATRDAVHDGIAQLREVIEALRRQVVVPGGLRPGLAEAVDDLRLRHGVRGRLHAPDELPPLPFAVEILLLETVRGCLVNVGRHAEASRADVGLEVNGSVISATISDDGQGFDPRTVPPGHHGLALMAQRVELARGSFAVCSETGQGTTVHVEVPV